MSEDRGISTAVIKRLPRYYRYLGYLIDNDVKKTSSKELAKMMNITASQIRQDLNNFGCFGQQGYGYDVNILYAEIKKILSIDIKHDMIIIGGGNLGQALANYKSFENRGFKVVGIFDKKTELLGKEIRGIQVYDMDILPQFLEENNIEIATLTLPQNSVEPVVQLLVKYKIKAIWNFTNMELDLEDEGIVVENTYLTDNLMTLSYRLNEKILKDKN